MNERGLTVGRERKKETEKCLGQDEFFFSFISRMLTLTLSPCQCITVIYLNANVNHVKKSDRFSYILFMVILFLIFVQQMERENRQI